MIFNPHGSNLLSTYCLELFNPSVCTRTGYRLVIKHHDIMYRIVMPIVHSALRASKGYSCFTQRTCQLLYLGCFSSREKKRESSSSPSAM